MLPESLSSSLSFPARLLLVIGWLVAGGLATWWARRRPAGRARAAVALPLVALNQLAAAAFFDGDAELISNCAHFITACITNMKLLAWAMGRGSLTHPLTLPQWLAVYALPLIPADEQAGPAAAPETRGAGEQEEEAEDSQAKRKGRRPGPTAQARSAFAYFRIFVRKLLALAATVWAFHRYAATLPRPLLLFVEGFSQYLGLSLGADAMAAVVTSTTGLAIAPPFSNPYASTSLADFWNRRWNMTVSAVLRAAVYDVIMEGRLVHRPGMAVAPYSRTRRLTAVLAVFFCSGIMHELLFWNFAGRFSPKLIWLLYFTLWGVLVVAENIGKRLLRSSGLSVPILLGRILTFVTIHTLGGYLWWPPMDQLGLPEKATAHTLQTWRALHKAALGMRTS